MVRYAGKSDKGQVRAQNEDAFCIVGDMDDAASLVAAVADGMGGHKAGGVASGMAMEHIAEDACGNPICGDGFDEVARRLSAIIDGANAKIYKRSLTERACAGMGTTLIIAVSLKGGKSLAIAHVGDSCAYLCKQDGRLQKITTDHTYVEELVRVGTLTREEALTHPRRNYITKAVGCAISVFADYYEVGVEPGDRVLLCTDGLSKMLDEDEITSMVLASDDPETICGNLVDRANERGGFDNITALTLVFN